MPERIIGFFQPVRERFVALERMQKIWIGAIILILLLALVLTVILTTRTVYRVAERDLSYVDALQVATLMDEAGIRNNIILNGTAVEVDQNRIDEARILIATRGIVPDRNFSYEDALSFSGIGATETVTRQNLLRARKADLERAITGMDGVLWAQVELDIPVDNRFFVQTGERPSSSILVRTSRRLSGAEGEAIARFVSRSVIGLEMENIDVLDSDFNILFDGSGIDSDEAELDMHRQHAAAERILVREMVRDLFPMYPIVSVAPNLVFNDRLSESEERVFAAPIPEMEGGLVQREVTAQASAQGTQTAWEPGLMPNMATVPTYPFGMPQDMRANQQEADRSFALNELFTRTRDVPNSYSRGDSSISITLARVVIHDQELMAAQNGGDFGPAEWLEHRMNTHHIAITDEDLIATYTQLVRSATGIEDVTVAVWSVPEFIDYIPTPLAWNQFVMYGVLGLLLLALAVGLIKKTKPEEAEEEMEPELSVEDLLVSTQMEELIEEDTPLEPIGYNEKSEAMQKLDSFIDEKPEAAASLLRHWLNEAEF